MPAVLLEMQKEDLVRFVFVLAMVRISLLALLALLCAAEASCSAPTFPYPRYTFPRKTASVCLDAHVCSGS